MTTYQINLTDAQNLALGYVSVSQDEWIQNVVRHRCEVAINEIARIGFEKCLADNIQVPATKDEIVALAFQNGWVKSSAEAQQEYLAAQQAQE